MKITLFRQINSATGSFGPLNFRIEIFDNCRMPTIGIDKAGAEPSAKHVRHPDICVRRVILHPIQPGSKYDCRKPCGVKFVVEGAFDHRAISSMTTACHPIDTQLCRLKRCD